MKMINIQCSMTNAQCSMKSLKDNTAKNGDWHKAACPAFRGNLWLALFSVPVPAFRGVMINPEFSVTET
jgi:hypothetical protein